MKLKFYQNISRPVIRILGAFWILWFGLMWAPAEGQARGAFSYRFPSTGKGISPGANTVIGMSAQHTVKLKETLLDIARDYGLGYNEMEDLYPKLDPWVPPEGTELLIPTQWILPQPTKAEILINVAELRLYYFLKKINMVKTYPIGIGDLGWFTPLGFFKVNEKRVHPTWHIPKSLQAKYGVKIISPGPENPLGDHWMGIGNSYGIHGTNFPWAVGRLVTHGCIRLYPEDIKNLFPLVKIGTLVEIIYEPVKLGFQEGRVFAEVHKDIYHKIKNFKEYGLNRLKEMGLENLVDLDKFEEVLMRQEGLPQDISAKL
jgi:L,D-transpeptidase ErfK/SrfK